MRSINDEIKKLKENPRIKFDQPYVTNQSSVAKFPKAKNVVIQCQEMLDDKWHSTVNKSKA